MSVGRREVGKFVTGSMPLIFLTLVIRDEHSSLENVTIPF